jgi:N-acetylneuraminic acid mutarotase/tRNA A-37 threonylcarbamoyl transferase component Bud32
LEGLCPNCVARLAFVLEPADGPAAGPRTPLPSGARLRYLGDYELLEEIARGGMGVVYKARQLSLNRTVAVKMILSGNLASAADVARFRAEAEAAANLRHPNIVAIHEIGEQDGQHYFSMEYVEGKSLAQVSAEGEARNADFSKLAECLKRIAEAIHYAHLQGTLHRDLKPSNVLLDNSGQPRITDFGLAKQLKRDSDLTLSGQVLGTPNFMSPEQAAGRRGAIGPQSDIYSLGAILYFLLVRAPPHSGESATETLAKVLKSEPAAPRVLNPAVPRDLETICLKCLEKEPRRRYLSAQDLAQDLGRFLRDEPILARPAGRGEKLLRTCRRHRVVTALSAGLVLLPIMAAVLVWRYAGRPASSLAEPNAGPIAEMPTRSAQGVAGVIAGKIYVTSPAVGVGATAPKFLHVFDPSVNSWKRLADSAGTHADAAGAVLAGKLYVAGGHDATNGLGSSLEVYDPDSNLWTVKRRMPTARAYCAGAVLNGRLYIVGGYDGAAVLSTVESYDPITGNWTTEEPMLTARAGPGVAAINGRLYVVGGGTNQSANGAATVETWKPGGKWITSITRNSMSTPVANAFVVASEGAIYVAGGSAAGAVADLQVFEPDRNIWGKRRPMPEVRYQGSGAVALKGELYLFGGWDDLALPESRVPHADVFVYDLLHNSWRRSVRTGAGIR